MHAARIQKSVNTKSQCRKGLTGTNAQPYFIFAEIGTAELQREARGEAFVIFGEAVDRKFLRLSPRQVQRACDSAWHGNQEETVSRANHKLCEGIARRKESQ